MDNQNGMDGREEVAGVQTRVTNGIHVVVLPDSAGSVDLQRVKELMEDDLPSAAEG